MGAGPSGLLLTIQLARGGIDVTLLDAGHDVDERPRAAHYMPCAVAELRKAGVLDDVRAKGLIPGNICWRKLDHSIVAEMRDSSQVNNPDALTVLPLGDLDRILQKHAESYSNVQIYFDHTVQTVEQNETSASVSGTKAEGTSFKFEGDYVCGTDGGQSTIRKNLFGRRFDGFSWDRQLIATNVSACYLLHAKANHV